MTFLVVFDFWSLISALSFLGNGSRPACAGAQLSARPADAGLSPPDSRSTMVVNILFIPLPMSTGAVRSVSDCTYGIVCVLRGCGGADVVV